MSHPPRPWTDFALGLVWPVGWRLAMTRARKRAVVRWAFAAGVAASLPLYVAALWFVLQIIAAHWKLRKTITKVVFGYSKTSRES